MLMAGVALTKPTSRAAKLRSSICSFLPKAENGRERPRRRSSAAGRLPSMTIPMDATTCIASSSGIREGSSFILPIYCTAPSVSPIREKARRNLAKPPNTFRLFCGEKWRQSISAAEKSRIGMLSFRRGKNCIPPARPPSICAAGMGMRPINIPREKAFVSSGERSPMPIGMVNASVHPVVAEIRMPA